MGLGRPKTKLFISHKGGCAMGETYRWVKLQIECPAEKGESELLLEWHDHDEEGTEVLNGMSCDNPKLRDLSGQDCDWSCWERVAEKKE